MFAKVRTSHLQHKEDSMIATVKGWINFELMKEELSSFNYEVLIKKKIGEECYDIQRKNCNHLRAPHPNKVNDPNK
ncbi:hypothetical protein FHG87_010156 [Trinorchestia longiramus]|nr:hypothetical protein FHG87_010156 [Trinorchestia longiramus]